MRIEVLAPEMRTTVGGRDVTLPAVTAKLLLALIVSSPTPMHVEQVSDVLWPELTVAAARPRLSSALHRLRRSLHPADDVTVRHCDVLSLHPSVEVDYFGYRRALATHDNTEDILGALAAVDGNLCEAQFPYDERLIEERHRFVAGWVHHARLHADRSESRRRLTPVLAKLSLQADVLG